MFRSKKTPLIGTLGMLALLVAASLALLFSTAATAREEVTNSFNPRAGEMRYNATYINQISPTQSSDKIEEVIPFPLTTVFMVRTKNTITVWERRGSEVVALMDIPLQKTLRSLQVLGDGRTFVVQTDDWVRVYSIDGRVPPQSPNNRR